jgi:parallel beta-helix repeat protein
LHSGQQTSDVGAIYVYSGYDSTALGDTIRYNTIIDTDGLGTNSSVFIAGQYWSAGIYLDDFTRNEKIYGNFIEGTTWGVLLHGGNNNDVWGNTIVGNQDYALELQAIKGTSMAGNMVHNNIIELPSTAGPTIYLDPSLVNPTNFYNNIYVSATGSMPVFGSALSSEPKWNTPADLIIGTVDQDLRECCHAMLFAFVG